MRLLIALTLLLIFNIACAGNPVLLVTGGDYPPLAATSEPGGGLTVRIVRAAFAKLGDEAHIDVLPWLRGYTKVLEGQYQATFPYIRTEERAHDFLFSEPIYTGAVYLYVRPGTSFKPGLPGALKGKSICVPHGWAIPQVASLIEAVNRGELRVERPFDVLSCAQMVASGRADAFSAHQALGDAILLKLAAQLHGKVQRSAAPLYHLEWYLIAPKNAPHSVELVERFNEGLQRLRADGDYQHLLKETARNADPR